ncbi:MAG: hypothetical protein ACRCST_00645 [Turicibacter sp.]
MKNRISVLDINDWVQFNLNFQHKEKCMFLYLESSGNLLLKTTVQNAKDLSYTQGIKEGQPIKVTLSLPLVGVTTLSEVETDQVVETVFKLTALFSLHEFQESFKYNDLIVFDPHDHYKDFEESKELVDKITQRRHTRLCVP